MDSQDLPVVLKFLFGSVAGTAAIAVAYPFNVIKTWMQIDGLGNHVSKNTYILLIKFLKQEGLSSFYGGLRSSIVREKTYTGINVGVYQTLTDLYIKELDIPPPFSVKVGCAFMGGAVAGFCSLPSDNLMIRMITAPPHERKQYRGGPYRMMLKVIKTEGFKNLFSGGFLTVLKAVVASVTTFVTYAETKEYLTKHEFKENSTSCHLISSIAATLNMSLLYLPFDAIKVRMHYIRLHKDFPNFNGAWDCFIQTIKKQGPQMLWKGFTPAFLSYGPYNAAFFLIYESLIQLYKISLLKDPDENVENFTDT